jgi:AcrR family transcriptional regulator
MGRPASDIRERLVDAARGRFLTEGVDGASLRDIAADAKTSLGIVVYYFPKKEDLFLAVVDSVYAPMLADVVRRLGDRERYATTRERLRMVVLRLADASTRELQVLRLIAREAIGSTTRRRRILRRFMSGHIPHLMAVLTEGVERGELDAAIPLPLMLVAFVGLGALPQVVRRAVDSRLGVSLPGKEKLADLSMEMFFRAVASARPPGRDR